MQTAKLEDMIKGAIILYGDPIIDALSESPYIQNNKELILNFINLIQKHKKGTSNEVPFLILIRASEQLR